MAVELAAAADGAKGKIVSLPEDLQKLAQSKFRRAKDRLAGVVNAEAEKRFGDMRINPFDGVVVMELDWNELTGFDYWNGLTGEGRFAIETSTVRKRCFREVSAAAVHYRLEPSEEARKRCGLGVERDTSAGTVWAKLLLHGLCLQCSAAAAAAAAADTRLCDCAAGGPKTQQSCTNSPRSFPVPRLQQ